MSTADEQQLHCDVVRSATRLVGTVTELRRG
jgi:hypothetical protein